MNTNFTEKLGKLNTPVDKPVCGIHILPALFINYEWPTGGGGR